MPARLTYEELDLFFPDIPSKWLIQLEIFMAVLLLLSIIEMI
jgi:hypothetical protein